jgi:hypothetical protein
MKLSRPAIVLGALAAVVLLIVVLGALLLPRLIDSQMVKAKLSAELAKETGGILKVGKIVLLWFPRPYVVVENIEMSFDGGIQASVRNAKIYPALFYLFTGRLVARQAFLQEPKVSIRLPESSEEPFGLEELEQQVRSLLVHLTQELPAPRLNMSDGSAKIRIGDKPPIILESVEAQTVASPAELRIELNARSNLCERLSVESRIAPENLASHLQIGVHRLKIKESLAFLPPQFSEYVQQGDASLDVNIASVGLRQVKASIDGSVGPLVFAWHDGSASVVAKRLKADVTYAAGALQVDLLQLDLGSPRLNASGEFKIGSGGLSARFNVRDVAVGEVRQLARLVDDIEVVKKTFQYLQAGTIAEMNFHSSGRSVAEMASGKNIVVSGSMSDAKIFIPGPDLELQNLTGSARLADSVLEAKDITANLGAIKGSAGKLRLGLEGKTASFHLDILVDARASDLHAVLLKLALDKAFRGELMKVQNVAGELSARLILGEALDAISPVVAISKADISGTYAAIPYPIAIRGGRLSYDQRLIRVENADGSVGRSSVRGLDVAFRRDGSRQIKIDSGRVLLDLQETDTLLRNFKGLRPHLAKLQSVGGRIDLENLTLEGLYDDPAGWTFASTGRLDQVEMTHEHLPGRISLARGQFTASQGRIVFSETSAAMLDASLVAGATFEFKKSQPLQLTMSGTGTLGAQIVQWLSRFVELPQELQLRSPLEIDTERLAWRAGGDISFRGRVTVAGGPQLTIDAVKQPQGLALRNLAIDDGDRRSRMTLQLANDNLDLSFSGELTQQTIDKIFSSSPMKGSSLRGDIQLSATLVDPIRVSAQGRLIGNNLWIPFGTEKALLERFSIEAAGPSLLVRSADLRLGKSRLTLAGEVTGAKEVLRVDMDVTADQLHWEELERWFGSEGVPGRQKTSGGISIPDVEGTIRLKADSFMYERFNVSPVETIVAISPIAISTEIKRGIVCGIHTTGRIEFADKDIKLDLQLSATNAPLEPTTTCLTQQQNDVTGTYSLEARITGRGDREHLPSALKGDFQLTARNGEFVRSPGIDATFDYLNATRDFKVAFPDLDRETFPYRFVGVKGRIEGNTLIGDEVTVNSSLLNLSGQGKVDLEQKQIDGKALIAVLKPVDEVISRIPVIGSIVGGSLIGIPVRVTGSVERPDVTYLSPADVGAELLNIPLRILGVPLEAIRVFTPSGEQRDKNVGK